MGLFGSELQTLTAARKFGFTILKHMKETEIAIVNFPPLIRSITNMLERIKGLLMVELHIKKRILWKTERRITM